MFVYSLFPPILFIFVCLPVFHVRGFSTFLDQGEDLKRSQYGLSVNHPFSVLSLTMASADTLNFQSLGLSPFSGINFFYPHRHIGFLILYSVKSIFTLLLNFLLQLFWCLCFHFLWFFFWSLWVIPCLFIYLFVALLSFQWHFRRE